MDRAAVEATLKWRGVVLADLLPTWGIRISERWVDHPLVRDFVTLTAAQVLRERGMRRGLSRTAALREACETLGLNYRTVSSRLSVNHRTYTLANERPTEVDGNPVQIGENAPHISSNDTDTHSRRAAK